MPETFPEVPLKRVCEIRLGKMLQPNPVSPHDVRVRYLKAGHLASLPISASEFPEMWASSADVKQYAVEAGDVIIAEGGDVGRTAFVPDMDQPTIIQNSLHRLRAPSDRLRFIRYVLGVLHDSGVLADVCNRSTIMHLTTEKLGAIRVPHPPRSLCMTIVDYLDRETARIDALRMAKRRLVAKLDERVDVLIARTLVRYDEFRVPLGRLPCVLQTGPFGTQLHADDYVDGGIPVINPSNLIDGGLVADFKVSVDTDTAARLSAHRLSAGDVVLARRGELGRAAVADASAEGWLCGTGCLSVRFSKGSIDPCYLPFAFLDRRIAAHLAVHSVGSTMGNINTRVVSGLPVVMPPVSLQSEVAEELSAKVAGVSDVIARLNRSVALLAERREALITAAVTGQLDVTREAPSAPEEALKPA
jgi:type I restriction enzyme, S subunit